MPKSQIIAGLDIGTGTIKALIVRRDSETRAIEVLGRAEKNSFGTRKGAVVDIPEVVRIIRDTFGTAQKQAGQKIDSVCANIGGAHIFSTISHGSVSVSRADKKISQADIERVLEDAQAFPLPLNKEILDVFPKEFIVDGTRNIKDPQDMRGTRLEVEILAICAFSPYVKNLTDAILSTGLQIDDLVPSPLAAAKTVLSSRQKELGVVLVDIGAGTSDMAVFEEGNLLDLATFPIGSSNISNDIAIGLRTDIDTAEKIKKQFGSCICQKGKKEKIKISQYESPLIFSRKTLVKIIEARVSEIFGQIQKELKRISRQGLLPAGVVLTGGGAKLPGIVELAKKEMKLPAQIGFPQKFIGLENDPGFATISGLVSRQVDLLDEEQGFLKFRRGAIAKLKNIFKIFIP